MGKKSKRRAGKPDPSAEAAATLSGPTPPPQQETAQRENEPQCAPDATKIAGAHAARLEKLQSEREAALARQKRSHQAELDALKAAYGQGAPPEASPPLPLPPQNSGS